MIKNLSAMQETQILSLCQQSPLEKKMAPHSSIPAWIIPWTEKTGGLQSMGSQRVGHDWVTNTLHTDYKSHQLSIWTVGDFLPVFAYQFDLGRYPVHWTWHLLIHISVRFIVCFFDPKLKEPSAAAKWPLYHWSHSNYKDMFPYVTKLEFLTLWLRVFTLKSLWILKGLSSRSWST